MAITIDTKRSKQDWKSILREAIESFDADEGMSAPITFDGFKAANVRQYRDALNRTLAKFPDHASKFEAATGTDEESMSRVVVLIEKRDS